jgi:hypothetical protein
VHIDCPERRDNQEFSFPSETIFPEKLNESEEVSVWRRNTR